MIDLHCHLLPGVDDGPADLEGTLALARAMVAGGTRTVTATPHIDETWGVDPLEVPGRVAIVQAALDEAGIPLRVLQGGEVSLSRLVEMSDDEVGAVRLGGGPYVLLECPLSVSAGDFHVFAGALAERGEHILLAHPERSPVFQSRPERLAALIDAGVLTSVTADALSGRFGQTVRTFAIELLRDGLVHNVASDGHDVVRRPPEIVGGLRAAAVELPWVLGRADWLTRAVPEAVLAGEPVPPAPPPPGGDGGPARNRRRWWSRA